MTSLVITKIAAACAGIASLAYLAVVAFAAVALAPSVSADWYAQNGVSSLSYGTDDEWYNYDFKAQNTGGYVDWPVRYFFYDDAEVDKVKDTADGCNGDPTIFPCLDEDGGPEYFRGKEGGSWYWDADSGIKMDLNCELDQHMRVYASSADRNYDANSFGYYILGVVHKDYEGSGCDDLFYSAEGEEGWWNSRFSGISGWAVSADDTYYYNAETARWADLTHWVQSNGYATYVGVP